MTKALTVHNAEIKTATVEVRTLTISGKQVTLAVFRQLREESLIAEDGSLNGMPWGFVNYHPDKCGPFADVTEHWHIVWQRGSELLRSSVETEPLWPTFWSKAGIRLLGAHLRDLLTGRESRFWQNKVPEVEAAGGRLAVHATASDVHARIQPSRACLDVMDAIQNRETLREGRSKGYSNEYFYGLDGRGERSLRKLSEVGSLVESHAEDAIRAVDREIGSPSPESATEHLYAIFKAEIAEEVARRQRHADQRAALAELPQLFIAV